MKCSAAKRPKRIKTEKKVLKLFSILLIMTASLYTRSTINQQFHSQQYWRCMWI